MPFARYAPERLRSLTIGGQHPYAQDMDEMRQVARLGVEDGPEAVVELWGGEPRTLSDETRERMYQRMLAYDYEAFLSAFQDRESPEAVICSPAPMNACTANDATVSGRMMVGMRRPFSESRSECGPE